MFPVPGRWEVGLRFRPLRVDQSDVVCVCRVLVQDLQRVGCVEAGTAVGNNCVPTDDGVQRGTKLLPGFAFCAVVISRWLGTLTRPANKQSESSDAKASGMHCISL